MGLLVPLPVGSRYPQGRFVADERHIPAVPSFGHFGEDLGKLRSWIGDRWNIAWELKRAEMFRLKLNDMFYQGFHYEDPWLNRINPVTNYCFSTVETVVPILTETRPRPEPIPLRSMDADRIKRLSTYATNKMDRSGFDRVFRLCVRDLLKHGWCCPMVGWDARGNSMARYLSPYDLYTDGATDESEMEFFFIARPVSVRRLRALFPHVMGCTGPGRCNCRDAIQPDNIVSPSYDSLVRPYLDYFGEGGRGGVPNIIGPMPAVAFEGQPSPGTTNYVADTGSYMVYGETAFLLQLFVRDYSTMPVKYVGSLYQDTEHGEICNPYSASIDEPACPSGWRMIPALANGTILAPPLPVDRCFDGVPVVIGRNYEQGGRFYAMGELDQVIPIQRAINRMDVLLDRALELSGNPPVLVSNDARLRADKSAIEAGEILRHARGATISYLAPAGVSEAHFARRAIRRQDVQIVGGTPDSLQGQRPVGVEAAAAMRQLIQQGSSRARAKGPSMLEWGAQLLRKMMRFDAAKSLDAIYFRGDDGTDAWVHPEDLRPDDWEIRWAQGTGTAQSEQDRRDLDFELFDRGAIDAAALLDDLNFPDRGRILQRVQLMREIQAEKAAQGARSAGGVAK